MKEYGQINIKTHPISSVIFFPSNSMFLLIKASPETTKGPRCHIIIHVIIFLQNEKEAVVKNEMEMGMKYFDTDSISCQETQKPCD